MAPNSAEASTGEVDVKIIVVKLLYEIVFGLQKYDIDSLDQEVDCLPMLFKEMDAFENVLIEEKQNFVSYAR